MACPCVPLQPNNKTQMRGYPEYEKLLEEIKQKDHTAYEHLDEEANIVVHKLKYIPIESRPNIVLISDLRTMSQDFSALTQEAISIAGGVWTDVLDIEKADKIIVIGNPAQLFADLPIVLQQEEFTLCPAVQTNEVYIIQEENFGVFSSQRFLDDIEILAEIIQPKYFIYGRDGKDWIRFDLT